MTERKRKMISGNILIVDDNPADRLMIDHFFRSEKFFNNIDICESVDRAKQLIETNRYQMAFVDVNLPFSGDGFDVVEALKNKGGCDVVMLSGTSETDNVAKANRMGAVGFITKPLTIPPLRDIVAEIDRVYWDLLFEDDSEVA